MAKTASLRIGRKKSAPSRSKLAKGKMVRSAGTVRVAKRKKFGRPAPARSGAWVAKENPTLKFFGKTFDDLF